MAVFKLVPMNQTFKLIKPVVVEETDGPIVILPKQQRIFTLRNPTSGLPLVRGILGSHLWTIKEEEEAYRMEAWRKLNPWLVGSRQAQLPPWEKAKDPFLEDLRKAVEEAEASFEASVGSGPISNPQDAPYAEEKAPVWGGHALKLPPSFLTELVESVEEAEKAVTDAWGDTQTKRP